MDQATLELILKAVDQASATLKAVSGAINANDAAAKNANQSHSLLGAAMSKLGAASNDLSGKLNLTGRAAGALHDIFTGLTVGLGIGAFTSLAGVLTSLTQTLPNMISNTEKQADATEQLVLQTGASAQSASRLLGIFQYLGLNTDSLGTRITQLSRTVVQHAAEWKALGVATEDSSGHLLNQLQILDNLRSVMSNASSGTTKLADAQQLLGKGAQSLLPYLSLTDAQVKALDGEMDKLGITMDEQGVVKAKALSQESNLLGMALQGLGNKITDTVAPALMSGLQSIADWVTKNSQNIANFVGQAISYIFGLINALTGSSLSVKPFAEQFQALNDVADKSATDTLPAITNATGKHTAANKAALDQMKNNIRGVQDHIKELGREITAYGQDETAIKAKITALNAEQTAQDKVTSSALSDIDQQLSAQDQLLSQQDQLYQNQQRAADLQDQMTSARANLATAQASGDPSQIISAWQQVNQVQQQMASAAFQQSQDAKKADVQATSDAVQKIKDELSGETDYRKALTDFQTQQTALASKTQADQQKGDAQAVTDDQILQQALQTAITQEQTNIRIGSAKTELTNALNSSEAKKKAATDERTHLETELQTMQDKYQQAMQNMQASGTGMANAVGGAITGAGGPVAGIQLTSDKGLQMANDLTNATHAGRAGFDFLAKGADPGATGAFAKAQTAGVQAGNAIKTAFQGIADTMNTIITLASQVSGAIGGITLTNLLAAGALYALLSGNLPLAAALGAAAGVSWAADLSSNQNTQQNFQNQRSHGAPGEFGPRTPSQAGGNGQDRGVVSGSGMSFGTGGVGFTSGATSMVIGEAGSEAYAILRNPQTVPTGGGAGTTHVIQLQVDGRTLAEIIDEHLFNNSRLWQATQGGQAY